MEERKAEVRRKLRERAVPASPLGRAFGFARLGANLVYGTVSDSVSRYIRGPPPGSEAGADGGQGSNRRAPSWAMRVPAGYIQCACNIVRCLPQFKLVLCAQSAAFTLV